MATTSDMHKRRKFTLSHRDIAVIDTALEELKELFVQCDDHKEARKIEKVRTSIMLQEQEHWNKENGYPKGFSPKKKKGKR